MSTVKLGSYFGSVEIVVDQLIVPFEALDGLIYSASKDKMAMPP